MVTALFNVYMQHMPCIKDLYTTKKNTTLISQSVASNFCRYRFKIPRYILGSQVSTSGGPHQPSQNEPAAGSTSRLLWEFDRLLAISTVILNEVLTTVPEQLIGLFL